MVLADFLTETRRRWLKAFKLFKRNNTRKYRNKISPGLIRSPSYSGTVDARPEIDLQRFCGCRTSLPPILTGSEDSSYYSSYNSYSSSRNDSIDYNESEGAKSDSAYNSARSSPMNRSVCYATVTYFNVNDSEDSSSIRTEFTLLEVDAEADGVSDTDERTQNIINESIELVSTL